MTTPQHLWQAKSEEEKIEWLAKFMGWNPDELWKEKDERAYALAKKVQQCVAVGNLLEAEKYKQEFEKYHMFIEGTSLKDCSPQAFWNPLTDWNHWRQVEMQVLGTVIQEKYWRSPFWSNQTDIGLISFFMGTTLATRAQALFLAVSSLEL